MSFIFISYSRKDQSYVSKLVQALEERQLPVWLDDRTDYGSTWNRVIEENLKNCQAFLLVMSPRSRESKWVNSELVYSLALNKKIFPLLLEGEHWFEVNTIQTVNVTKGNIPSESFFSELKKEFHTTSSQSKPLGKKDLSLIRNIQDLTPTDPLEIDYAEIILTRDNRGRNFIWHLQAYDNSSSSQSHSISIQKGKVASLKVLAGKKYTLKVSFLEHDNTSYSAKGPVRTVLGGSSNEWEGILLPGKYKQG